MRKRLDLVILVFVLVASTMAFLLLSWDLLQTTPDLRTILKLLGIVLIPVVFSIFLFFVLHGRGKGEVIITKGKIIRASILFFIIAVAMFVCEVYYEKLFRESLLSFFIVSVLFSGSILNYLRVRNIYFAAFFCGVCLAVSSYVVFLK